MRAITNVTGGPVIVKAMNLRPRAMTAVGAFTVSLALGLANIALADSSAPVSVPSQTLTRNEAYTYFGSGLLQTKTIEPSGGLGVKLVLTYSYDTYGNRKTETLTGFNGVVDEDRLTTTNWDGVGRFPTDVTNPIAGVGTASAQTETLTHDDRFGVVTKRVSINGQVTRWEYDDFGRKIYERRGYASDAATTYLSYTRWDYLLCSDSGSGCPSSVQGVAPAYVVVASTNDSYGFQIAPTIKVYYDVLNRELRSETQVLGEVNGANAAAPRAVFKDTIYDARGNVWKVSRPYFDVATPNWSEMLYDDLGRKTSETTPNGLVTLTDYSGLVTTTTVQASSGNRVRVSTSNAKGLLVQAQDPNGAVTEYVYDAQGRLTHVFNPYGDVVQTTYDVRGRRTELKDGDLGIWTYAPNAFDEVVTQQGPSGTTRMAYDKLGRVKQRYAPDLKTTWEYDSAGYGKGQLAKVWTDNGYCRSHDYDTLSRQTASTLKVGTGDTACSSPTKTLSSLTGYDNVGRVSTQTFPTSLQVKYRYDATLGTLLGVKQFTGGVKEGLSYWTRESGDAADRTTKFLYGNNIDTLRSYDDSGMGWLKSISAGTTGNAAVGDVQLSSYGYDNTGQISRREDKFDLPGTVYECFEVDALGRLRTAGRYTGSNSCSNASSLIAGSQVAVEYDAIGRIKSKTDVGTYYYLRPSGARPHAVTAVRGIAGDIDYGYDGAGQMTSRNGLTYVYTSSGHLRMGGSANSCQEFLMQGEGLRWQQTIFGAACNSVAGQPSNGARPIQAQTLYMHPDASNGLSFEIETKGGVSTYRHYINADGRPVALVSLNESSSTTVALASDSDTRLKVSYLHYDHLGSIVVVTNANGSVLERRSFDAWGRVRAPNGAPGTGELPGGLANQATDRGFTLHEHLEGLGLIHMNGRIYDPLLARFTSADPNVTAPLDLQSYDRYAYVMNRPLDAGDPSGYDGESMSWNMSGASGQGFGIGFEFNLRQLFNFFTKGNFGGSSGNSNGQTGPAQPSSNAVTGSGTPRTAGPETKGIDSSPAIALTGSSVGEIAGQGLLVTRDFMDGGYGTKTQDAWNRRDYGGVVGYSLAGATYGVLNIATLGEGQAAVKLGTKAVQEFAIVSYRPVSKGLENHHGVLDIWASANIPGYISRAANSVSIALSREAHDATKVVFREWLRENYGKAVGPVVDWTKVSAREVHALAEKMFDAAKVPQAARDAYYRAFNQYIYGLAK